MHKKPLLMDEKPLLVNEKPLLVNEKPLLVNEKPLLVNEKPLLVNEKPLLVNEKPLLVNEKPLLVNEKPLLVHEKPLLVHEKPLLVNEEPLLVDEEVLFRNSAAAPWPDRPCTAIGKPPVAIAYPSLRHRVTASPPLVPIPREATRIIIELDLRAMALLHSLAPITFTWCSRLIMAVTAGREPVRVRLTQSGSRWVRAVMKSGAAFSQGFPSLTG